MKIHLKILFSNAVGTRIAHIIDGTDYGHLVLPPGLVKQWLQVVQNGTGCGEFEGYKLTGDLYDPCGEPPAEVAQRMGRKAKDG